MTEASRSMKRADGNGADGGGQEWIDSSCKYWYHKSKRKEEASERKEESAPRMLHSLYIINKSGGLVYQQDLSSAAPKLSSNDHLRLGSTFHSMHAIAVLASPVASGGIEMLETDTFRLQCFQTPTGLKFFLTAALGTPDLDAVLRTVYELYVDYVLKNPFYELEMPIRCSLFNSGLKTFVDKFNADSSRRRPQGSELY